MSNANTTQPRNRDRQASVDGANAQAYLREFLYVLFAVREGDFSVRLPGHWTALRPSRTVTSRRRSRSTSAVRSCS